MWNVLYLIPIATDKANWFFSVKKNHHDGDDIDFWNKKYNHGSNYPEYSHRKRKDSLKTRALLLIFSLELEISGVAIQRIQQNSKNVSFCEESHSENDFEVVLATFCCHDNGGSTSEAVPKIATDQKDYHKCSSSVRVC